jgi:outer membrane receptor protein involved in Fe transport
MLDNSSFAAFAEVDIKPLTDLTLTLGGRYTEEKKTARAAASSVVFGVAGARRVCRSARSMPERMSIGSTGAAGGSSVPDNTRLA